MQIGIWLYKNRLIGYIQTDRTLKGDYYLNHYSLLRDSESLQSYYKDNSTPILSYLYWPIPQLHPERSLYISDEYECDDYSYPDPSLPARIHLNHATSIIPRINWKRHLGNYTYYELTDGTTAYTKNYKLLRTIGYHYGFDPWTTEDTSKVLHYLHSMKAKTPNAILETLEVMVDFLSYVGRWCCKSFCLILISVTSLLLMYAGILYFINEYQVVNRLKID